MANLFFLTDLPMGDNEMSSPKRHQPNLSPSRLGFAWRMVAFVILEFGFLALAGYCLTNPILVYLPSFITPSQAKSATTAVAVAWRTLAVFPIQDIIFSVFSAECAAQYRRTGRLEPNSSDRVSRATSGLVDQVTYFWKRQPTLEYRLAFFLVLLVMVIGPLGPGTIALTESPTKRSQDFRVANMSMDQGFASFDQRQISQRAKTFVGLELLEGRVYGYETPTEGILIPWPEFGFERSQNITMYESDVAVYNYSCQWSGSFSASMPANANRSDLAVVIPGVSPNGTEWVVWGDGMDNHSLDEGMLTSSGIFLGLTNLPCRRDISFDEECR